MKSRVATADGFSCAHSAQGNGGRVSRASTCLINRSPISQEASRASPLFKASNEIR